MRTNTVVVTIRCVQYAELDKNKYQREHKKIIS